MSFLDEVRQKRQKLADVLSDPEYSGIREIVEELYPDRAHFIYELLQNAEDVGATVASFSLHADSVSFEHNGRPFDELNVWLITNIGKGRIREQEEKIGRFGVGFKAVFAYCDTPYVWSPTFSFKIKDLVLPWEIDARPELGKKTRFDFPFNNAKKPADVAFLEIAAGLGELAETTLLFLSHLESIRWQIGDNLAGQVLRVPHPENHIEVLKEVDGKKTASSHFLRFSESVTGLEKQQVSIAFVLEPLANVNNVGPAQSLSKRFKIVPAEPGRVAVFFPAVNETSCLRFHLHAPFVPELSRASVKETPKNNPLFEQLAQLAAKSLHTIRDMGLLTREFLAVLPHKKDMLGKRYTPFHDAIITEMTEQPLTPTDNESHAPAQHLVSGPASLKALLIPDDLRFVLASSKPLEWAIGAFHGSSIEQFLDSLGMVEIDEDRFVDWVATGTLMVAYYQKASVKEWLASKPLDWHQQFYSFLHTAAKSEPQLSKLREAEIVRLRDRSYWAGSKCCFPGDTKGDDEGLLFVDQATFVSAGVKVS